MYVSLFSKQNVGIRAVAERAHDAFAMFHTGLKTLASPVKVDVRLSFPDLQHFHRRIGCSSDVPKWSVCATKADLALATHCWAKLS